MPVRPALPEEAFGWLRRSVIAQGATVTVVTGLPTDEVVRAFGGDPREPVSLRRINHVVPTVAVLDRCR
ncbi:hypothetical protein Val02_62300 [Virgisporangium aliadipatigenens]|uniref:Uncharacterized protein n=1 Tax=Virgisporangium aliadipatigenens TaxID=741659 RepID=A0A8J4DT23_9ACTN|nr:hypothetical protein [Virgisporangium aliadipatigenens]GIJ49344.1 hypothetical protein Val02_62300 [Virgisporangium aliadipatigenens]